MKRYYLAKISQVTEGDFTFWRHAGQAYPNIVMEGGDIAVDPQTGRPTQPAILIIVADKDHTKFKADPGMVPLPIMPAGAKVAATHVKAKTDFRNAAVGLGLAAADVDSVLANADGWADVLDHLGKKNNPTFSYLNFDVDAA